MIVTDVELCVGHVCARVRLPARGLAVVTGANGSGKSALFVDAVAAALWGQTVRGEHWYGDDEDCQRVTVTIGQEYVTRERHRRATSVEWGPVGATAAKSARAAAAMGPAGGGVAGAVRGTMSVVEPRLVAAYGSFERWVRTSVLSSADAAHFSLATDAQRKRFVEEMLGLERFDQAEERCKTALVDAVTRHKIQAEKDATLSRRVEMYDVTVARATDEAARCAAALAEFVDDPEAAHPGRGEELARIALAAAAEHLAKDGTHRTVLAELAKLEAHGRVLRTEQVRLRVAECRECGRAFDDAERHAKLLDVDRRLAALDAEDARLHERAVCARQAADVAAGEAADACGLQLQHAERARAAAQTATARQRVEVSRREAEAQAQSAARLRDAARQARVEVGEQLRVEERRVAELEAGRKVLGLRGLRATLLDDALRAVTVTANAYLSRLGGGATVALQVEDARLALHVAGACAPTYRGMSAGQRRRVDIAVLLALGETAAAVDCRPPGTLFLDEPLDSLDADGVEAAAALLEDLAKERPVVLVTHSAQLASSVRAAPGYRYHFDSTGLRVLG